MAFGGKAFRSVDKDAGNNWVHPFGESRDIPNIKRTPFSSSRMGGLRLLSG
jgi:hypothetical protein